MIWEKLKQIKTGIWKGWWQHGANKLSPELYEEIKDTKLIKSKGSYLKIRLSNFK